MKNAIITIALFLAVAMAGYSYYLSRNHQNELEVLRMSLAPEVAGEPTGAEEHSEEEEHGHHELVESMGHMQRYMNKLWFAGKATNWELADFYTHELEETMEVLIHGEIEEDGHNISVLIETMAIPSLESLEDVLKNKDSGSFEGEYLGLVNACNSCHQVTEHAFLKIQEPSSPAFTNQVYEVE